MFPPISHPPMSPDAVMLSDFRTCNSLQDAPPKVHRLTVICAWCGMVKQQGDSQHLVSHGICEVCAEVWKLQAHKALMKPEATRSDCQWCDYCAYDFDGVPESCDRLIGEACVRHDRRNSWEWK